MIYNEYKDNDSKFSKYFNDFFNILSLKQYNSWNNIYHKVFLIFGICIIVNRERFDATSGKLSERFEVPIDIDYLKAWILEKEDGELVDGKFKDVWYYRADVEKHAQSTYTPGQQNAKNK